MVVKLLSTLPSAFGMALVLWLALGKVWPMYLYMGWFLAATILMVALYPKRRSP